MWNIAMYGPESCKLRELEQKYMERFKMWCWSRMEKIDWNDHVRNGVTKNQEGREYPT
jgi:hypothetical protein